MALRIFVFIFGWNFLLAVRQTNPNPNAIFSMYHIPRHFHQTKSIINQNTSLLTQTHIHASPARGEEDFVYFHFLCFFDRWRYSWFGSRRSINKIIVYAIPVLSFAYNVHTILIFSVPYSVLHFTCKKKNERRSVISEIRETYILFSNIRKSLRKPKYNIKIEGNERTKKKWKRRCSEQILYYHLVFVLFSFFIWVTNDSFWFSPIFT